MKYSIIVLLLFLLLLEGCSILNKKGEEINMKDEGSSIAENLIFSLDIDAKPNFVTFTLKLQNKSSQDVRLLFSSGQIFDIVVKNKQNEEVYRYSNEKMFTQSFQTIIIKPGEEKIWRDQWNYTKNQLRVKPGEYLVTAQIVAKKINNTEIAAKQISKRKIFKIDDEQRG